MRIRSLLPLAVLVAAVPAAAQPTQTYHSEVGYTVQLPAEWRRMPESDLREVRRVTRRAPLPLTVEAGYRVGSPGSSMPYITVSRMDLGETIALEEFSAAFQSAEAQARMQDGVEQTDAVRVGARMGVPVWDEENRIAWTRMHVESDGSIPAFAWMVAMLHPSGERVLVFTYYGAPESDEEQARADLLAIVRSLRTE